MGMEKYEDFVRRADGPLTYDPGWSRDNLTGGWRSQRPVIDPERCNHCDICWLFCPDSCIAPATEAIDLNYCKGCGICAEVCSRDAIEMQREGGTS